MVMALVMANSDESLIISFPADKLNVMVPPEDTSAMACLRVLEPELALLVTTIWARTETKHDNNRKKKRINLFTGCGFSSSTSNINYEPAPKSQIFSFYHEDTMMQIFRIQLFNI